MASSRAGGPWYLPGRRLPLRAAALLVGVLLLWAGVRAAGAQLKESPGAPPPTSEQKRQFQGPPAGRRDPFRPLIQKPTAPPASQREIPLTRLKLVGIIWDGGRTKALVETKEGQGYILRENDTIMGGRVIEISNEGVRFALSGSGGPGQEKPRIVSFTLHSQE